MTITEYNLPNDGQENERLGITTRRCSWISSYSRNADLQHHLFLLTFNDKLGLSPPNEREAKTKRVLDLGTGTGVWAVDYADEHSEAEVSHNSHPLSHVPFSFRHEPLSYVLITDLITGRWDRSISYSTELVCSQLPFLDIDPDKHQASL